MSPDTVVIAGRFNGPAGMGNGGYVSGRIAGYVGTGSVEVTLRAPCPLDTPLVVAGSGNGEVSLLHGEQVIVAARAGEPAPGGPKPVTPEQAQSVRGQLTSMNPFGTCFVCGHARPQADGLEILPGLLPDRGLVVAPWTPAHEFADADGATQPTAVWAALDCPSGWANALVGPMPPMVLARFTVQVHRPVPAGEPTVVGAWHLASEGRRHRTASAIWSPTGTVLASAHATWITLRAE